MALKFLDAGDYLMLSGDSQEEVEDALSMFETRGAKVVSRAAALGSHWTAACTLPTGGAGDDTTDSLTLSDLWETASRTSVEPEVDDGRSVEEVGFKRIVTGPSQLQVLLRIRRFTRIGAELTGEIERDGDKWVAIVDTAGISGTYDPYHWQEKGESS